MPKVKVNKKKIKKNVLREMVKNEGFNPKNARRVVTGKKRVPTKGSPKRGK